MREDLEEREMRERENMRGLVQVNRLKTLKVNLKVKARARAELKTLKEEMKMILWIWEITKMKISIPLCLQIFSPPQG